MSEKITMKGTARWYKPRVNAKGTSIPGKFSVKKEIAENVPFDDAEEVIIEVNTENRSVTITKL